MSIEDYDVLGILGDTISSASYKVKHKTTKEVFVWRTVDYEGLNDNDKKYLLSRIVSRKNLAHPNLLQFYDYIDQKESKLLYLVTEYCPKGNLQNVIDNCLKNKTLLSEELLSRILYQIVCTLKTAQVEFVGKIILEEIFLDEGYNVKLYNFNILAKKAKIKEEKMSALGVVLYELLSLKPFEKTSYENELKQLSKTCHSSSLLSVISHMISDNSELKKNINKILCHPTVLLKSSQWSIEKCYIINNLTEAGVYNNAEEEQEKITLEKLRNFQATLKIREQKLLEKEHKLLNREKKLAVMERIVNEKITQADLYLKRCRETKSSSSGSGITTKKPSYENLDTTSYSADCGDSVIIPTSSKLNVREIIKPAPFTRTLSERRIRFKGHSPLKEMNFNHRKSQKFRLGAVVGKPKNEDCIRSGSRNSMMKKAKNLFVVEENVYENDGVGDDNKDFRPVSWSEENKKYAFEMLRIMNETTTDNKENVKHTYL